MISKSCVSIACIIGGDFNNVLNVNERIGSSIPIEEVMEFRECLRACFLHETVTSGPFFFTWSNKEGLDSFFKKN